MPAVGNLKQYVPPAADLLSLLFLKLVTFWLRYCHRKVPLDTLGQLKLICFADTVLFSLGPLVTCISNETGLEGYEWTLHEVLLRHLHGIRTSRLLGVVLWGRESYRNQSRLCKENTSISKLHLL